MLTVINRVLFRSYVLYLMLMEKTTIPVLGWRVGAGEAMWPPLKVESERLSPDEVVLQLISTREEELRKEFIWLLIPSSPALPSVVPGGLNELLSLGNNPYLVYYLLEQSVVYKLQSFPLRGDKKGDGTAIFTFRARQYCVLNAIR